MRYPLWEVKTIIVQGERLMKLKRFSAPDMRQAMAMVREALGPDAVIVGNKTTADGVEIVVAIEDQQDLERSRQPSAKEKADRIGVLKKPTAAQINAYSDDSDVIAEPRKRLKEAAAKQKKDELPNNPKFGAREELDATKHIDRTAFGDATLVSELTSRFDAQELVLAEQRDVFEQVKNELQGLKDLIQSKMNAGVVNESLRNEPHKHELLKSLLEIGLSPSLIRRILANVSGRNVEQMLVQSMSLLAKWLTVSNGDMLDLGGAVALVGPTGVGKTTTLAKLAARFVMRHGKNQLAIVNLDNYRIGAYENLKIYGRILGVPVRNAANAQELQQILKENYDKKLVLLDTAGIGQRDSRVDDLTGIMNDESAGIKTCLVLGANVTPTVMRESIQRFQPRRLSGVILTKLDEATSLGGAFSELISQKLPLIYVTDGQRVPEDIHKAENQKMVEHMVMLWKQNKQWLENESVELMAGGFAQQIEHR